MIDLTMQQLENAINGSSSGELVRILGSIGNKIYILAILNDKFAIVRVSE